MRRFKSKEKRTCWCVCLHTPVVSRPQERKEKKREKKRCKIKSLLVRRRTTGTQVPLSNPTRNFTDADTNHSRSLVIVTDVIKLGVHLSGSTTPTSEGFGTETKPIQGQGRVAERRDRVSPATNKDPAGPSKPIHRIPALPTADAILFFLFCLHDSTTGSALTHKRGATKPQLKNK